MKAPGWLISALRAPWYPLGWMVFGNPDGTIYYERIPVKCPKPASKA